MRVALGAPASRILRLIVTEVLSLAVIGLVLGLGAALAFGRSMTSLLYEVSATDPLTFVGIGVVAILTSVLASAIPAMRAVACRSRPSLAKRVGAPSARRSQGEGGRGLRGPERII